MVLTRQACSLTNARVWRHIPRGLLLHGRCVVSVVLSRGDTEAGLLSKSLLDGKHKVINLRPAGRPGWTVWRGDSLESLAGVRRKRAHPIGFSTKVILTLVNLQEFMFENPSGDVRGAGGGTLV